MQRHAAGAPPSFTPPQPQEGDRGSAGRQLPVAGALCLNIDVGGGHRSAAAACSTVGRRTRRHTTRALARGIPSTLASSHVHPRLHISPQTSSLPSLPLSPLWLLPSDSPCLYLSFLVCLYACVSVCLSLLLALCLWRAPPRSPSLSLRHSLPPCPIVGVSVCRYVGVSVYLYFWLPLPLSLLCTPSVPWLLSLSSAPPLPSSLPLSLCSLGFSSSSLSLFVLLDHPSAHMPHTQPGMLHFASACACSPRACVCLCLCVPVCVSLSFCVSLCMPCVYVCGVLLV